MAGTPRSPPFGEILRLLKDFVGAFIEDRLTPADTETAHERTQSKRCARNQWPPDRPGGRALDRHLRKKPGVLRSGIPQRRWKVGTRVFMVPLSRRSPAVAQGTRRPPVILAAEPGDVAEDRAPPRRERGSRRQDPGCATDRCRGSAASLDQSDLAPARRLFASKDH